LSLNTLAFSDSVAAWCSAVTAACRRRCRGRRCRPRAVGEHGRVGARWDVSAVGRCPR
jgi:hypothetical protein